MALSAKVLTHLHEVLHYLHCAENTHVNMPAADHGETLVAGEIGTTRQNSDRFLACDTRHPELVPFRCPHQDPIQHVIGSVNICIGTLFLRRASTQRQHNEPALIKSASCSPSWGNGPNPKIPFSDCSVTFMPSGMKLLASIGIPIPRLACIPSRNSFAARRTMRSRRAAGVPGSAETKPPSASTVLLSMRFSLRSALTMRFTYTPVSVSSVIYEYSGVTTIPRCLQIV